MRHALQLVLRKELRPGLLLIVAQDEEQLGQAAAQLVADTLQGKPGAVLALPTGRTPIGMYASLVEMRRHCQVTFSRATIFNLDEFVGLAPSHPGSYHAFMQRYLFDHVDADLSRVHIPDGAAPNLEKECDRYESEIALAGGIDLAVLGIGENGHIGFNEPGSLLDSRTRAIDLATTSAAANAHLFARLDDVPRRAITMGVGTILESRRLLLLASGSSKADALLQALRGPVTSALPASSLQLHPSVVVIADREAAAQVE